MNKIDLEIKTILDRMQIVVENEYEKEIETIIRHFTKHHFNFVISEMAKGEPPSILFPCFFFPKLHCSLTRVR